MNANNRFFDDLSKLMTNAMGVAQGAKDEAQTAFNGWIDRWLAERDFVTREEFEAVREMALMCQGTEAMTLFELLSAEIQAGRHLHPGSAQ